jgi:hypothetical protein
MTWHWSKSILQVDDIYAEITAKSEVTLEAYSLSNTAEKYPGILEQHMMESGIEISTDNCIVCCIKNTKP